MKKVILFALSLGAFGVANAATFNLNDGNAMVLGTDTGALADWTTDGTDNLFGQEFFFRIGGTGAEATFGSLGASAINVISASSVELTFTQASVFRARVRYSLVGGANGSGTSDLATQVRIDNLTGAALDFHLFEYNDFDIANSSGGDTAYYDEGLIYQYEGGTTSMHGNVAAPSAWEISTYPSLLASLLDGSATNLGNASSPVGPADIAFGLQWNYTIAAGGSKTMSGNKVIETVPEPATMAALGLGLAAMARRRRK